MILVVLSNCKILGFLDYGLGHELNVTVLAITVTLRLTTNSIVRIK